ncbi:MAG: PHP C-terminal domain protein, partial [Methanoculleus marisnigri]
LTEEELTRIPGIGVRIAGQIHEIAATGSFGELESLQATIPGSIVELLGVAGVGPRTLHTLWKRLGILTVEGWAVCGCGELPAGVKLSRQD